MKILERSNKMGQEREGGYSQIRVWLRKAHKKGKSIVNPRLLLKCGCCQPDKDEMIPSGQVEICIDENGLEINGVNGSIEDWREILLPLLKIETNNETEVKD